MQATKQLDKKELIEQDICFPKEEAFFQTSHAASVTT
jgi:hypothetical protein